MKKRYKSHYDHHVYHSPFHERDLVVGYDQAYDTLGWRTFESLWYGPYLFKKCLGKREFLLSNPNGELIKNP